MFDVEEYMLSRQEKEKVLLEIVTSINEVVCCLADNDVTSEELAQAVSKMNQLRAAYIALTEHSRKLIA